MTTPKDNVNEKIWIALGMIDPEWIYMNHFLNEEELEEEPVPFDEDELEEEPVPTTPPSSVDMRVTIRARIE